MNIIKHVNKYDQISQFMILDQNSILWEGDFKLNEISSLDGKYYSIKPIGGPEIKIGTKINYILSDLEPLDVYSILDHHDGGYILKLK